MQDVNIVIHNNRGLVHKQLGKFKLTDDPEAESIAYEALYNAVCTYKESSKAKFSTYATVCIYNALGSYVRTLNKKRKLEVISYNNYMYNDENKDTEIVSMLPTTCCSAEELFIQAENVALINSLMDEVYNGLSEKQQIIVKCWQSSGYDSSTTKISKEVGISQSYVSQSLTIFKNRLRNRLKEELKCSIL